MSTRRPPEGTTPQPGLITGTGCLVWLFVLVAINVLLYYLFRLRSTEAQRHILKMLTSGISGAKVILFFAIIYIYLPYRFINFDKSDAYLDRLVIGFTLMSAVVVLIVHLLALLKVYDFISAWISLVSICYFLRRSRLRNDAGETGGSRASALDKAFGQILDGIDGKGGVYSGLIYPLIKRVEILVMTWCGQMAHIVYSAHGLLLVFSLAYPLYIRFHHAVTKAYYGYGDPYVHLAWMKYMAQGLMYKDGIYPHGMHSVLSILDRAAMLDPYWIVRYGGALIGTLLILSVFYFVLHVSHGFPEATVAAFMYGIECGLPVWGWRQAITMPQEYAALFLLPGTIMLWRYLKGDGRRYLYLYLASYFLTLSSHPFVAFYFLIVTGCVLAACGFARQLTLRRVAALLALGVATSVVGSLPYSLGIALGKKLHSVEWALSTQVLTSARASVSLKALLAKASPSVLIGLGFAVIAVLIGILLGMRRGSPPQAWLISGMGLSTIVMYLAYEARNLGLPQVIDPERTQMFFSLLCVTVIGCLLCFLQFIVPRRVRTALAICAFVILGVVFHPQPYAREIIEYSAAAENYLSIQREFGALSWTLVAPVEQYQQVLGKGWHYEIWRFAVDFNPQDVAREGFDFPIPTPDIFVMVEKVPLGADKPVSPETALEPLPAVSKGETDFYYRDVKNRSIVEARAMAICEAYMATHKGTGIYYEDDQIRVYRFEHDASPFVSE